MDEYGVSNSLFSLTGDYVRLAADFFSLWAQINISFAIAIERYILIVWATDAGDLLNKKRRKKLYAFVMIWIVFPVVFYFSMRTYIAQKNGYHVSANNSYNPFLGQSNLD